MSLPCRNISKHALIPSNLSQSKTYSTHLFFVLTVNIDKFLTIFHCGGPTCLARWHSSRTASGPIKAECKWPLLVLYHKSLLMLIHGTLLLPVSLSLPLLSSWRGGGAGSLGTNGEERAASGCYHHESQGKAQSHWEIVWGLHWGVSAQGIQ